VKDKGQHILKNPLVINSMIEKVCMYVHILESLTGQWFVNFFVLVWRGGGVMAFLWPGLNSFCTGERGGGNSRYISQLWGYHISVRVHSPYIMPSEIL